MNPQTKPFRVHAKKLLLTYSQVPQEMPYYPIILMLQKEIEGVGYVIGVESHQDDGKHFHVVAVSPTKLDIRSHAKFDVTFENNVYKCNCQGIKRLSAAVKYVCKHGVYTTNLKNLYEGALLPTHQLLIEMSNREGIHKTLQFYGENYPKEAIGSKNLLSVERTLKRMRDLSRTTLLEKQKALETPFQLEDFKVLPKIKQWIDNEFQPSLILVGPPGCGKTQFVKALAKKYKWNILFINHREGFKHLTPEHDAVALDDTSLENLDAGALLALFEKDDSRTVRILHGSVEKKGGLVQIFIFNKEVFDDISHHFKQRQFSRRVYIVIAPNDFINPKVVNNLNINNTHNTQNINIHNHIYNNPQTIRDNDEVLSELRRTRFKD